jgi:hypothetical protein
VPPNFWTIIFMGNPFREGRNREENPFCALQERFALSRKSGRVRK